MKKIKTLFAIIVILMLTTVGYLKYYDINTNEVGLKALTWVKNVRGNSVNYQSLEDKESPIIDHQIWSDLLQKQVTASGKVNYDGFRKDSVQLLQYLGLLSNHAPGKNWTAADKLAYWINAYNAFTVQLILDHYPLTSIKNISNGLPMINSPWDIKFFKIGGIPFDLNTIEHEILRKTFKEPRIHFAINCASFSCPNLRNEAYQSAIIEEQLEAQANAFINDKNKNQISETATKLSKIFSWFASDFGGESEALSFIKKYNSTLNNGHKVEYLDYDWTLNN